VKEGIIAAITKSNGRKSLFHFTRLRNLSAIAHFDALLSSSSIDPQWTGERRSEPRSVSYGGHTLTINAHLKIPGSMFEAGTTQEQFRACLDRHVFFWPTLKDCQKMIDTYSRREPDEQFAVLEFAAHSVLTEHYSAVKLSKYDSGSAPRFPGHCSYRKSPEMFLPANRFKTILNHTVPVKASEIREILVEDQVAHVSRHLRAVYVDDEAAVPEPWKDRTKPLARLRAR
jgi:hypothetical protein